MGEKKEKEKKNPTTTEKSMKFKSERFGIRDSSGRGGRRGRWEDNIREWTGPEFGKSQGAVENGEKME